MDVMKGDQYALRCIITIGEDAEEHNLTPDEIDDMEIIVGRHSKTFAMGEVEYDADNAEWLYPFRQEDSFCFGPVEAVQARVKILGSIYGLNLGTVNTINTLTRRRL